MFVQPLFHDRGQAGRVLAERLRGCIEDPDALILALPRGGVPVAFEVARALHFELDVLLVRKLGVPGQEELAMGAIASGGSGVLNHGLIAELGLSAGVIDRVMARERREVERREHLYREGRPALQAAQRTVILVDDGLATGATMQAAARALREQLPRRIIVGVPVASPQACADLREFVDEVICAATPEPFYAVGAWYEDFSQIADAEVRALLARAAHEHAA